MTFRINKCIVGYSRRQADSLLANGRVKVNGKVITVPGIRVNFGDSISVDNQPIQWESYVQKVYANTIHKDGDRDAGQLSQQPLFSVNDGFLYLKMWKPMNTITTTASFDKDSIIKYLHQQQSSNTPSNMPNKAQLQSLLGDKKTSRIFPVGRLDKDTTGIILLTSNPRFQFELLGNKKNKVITTLPSSSSKQRDQMTAITETNSDSDDEIDELDLDLLAYQQSKPSSASTPGRSRNDKNNYAKNNSTYDETSSSSLSRRILSSNSPFYEKVYEVTLDKAASNEALDAWRSGMVITSSTTNRKKIVSPTLPCIVNPLSSSSPIDRSNNSFIYQFILQEGRNRQLHRMTNAFGYEIQHIHRTKFCQITLDGLSKPGDWKTLTEEELKRICTFVQQ